MPWKCNLLDWKPWRPSWEVYRWLVLLLSAMFSACVARSLRTQAQYRWVRPVAVVVVAVAVIADAVVCLCVQSCMRLDCLQASKVTWEDLNQLCDVGTPVDINAHVMPWEVDPDFFGSAPSEESAARPVELTVAQADGYSKRFNRRVHETCLEPDLQAFLAQALSGHMSGVRFLPTLEGEADNVGVVVEVACDVALDEDVIRDEAEVQAHDAQKVQLVRNVGHFKGDIDLVVQLKNGYAPLAFLDRSSLFPPPPTFVSLPGSLPLLSLC